MLTLRGWLCLGFGGLTIVAGRLFGLPELYIIGSALLVLAIIGLSVAVMRPLRLAVGRSVSPARVHVGSAGRVELAVRNGPTKSPVLRLVDHVAGTSGAQLLISGLKADEVLHTAYRLPTERRGLVDVGPAEFVANDPFGIAKRAFTASGTAQFVVYPEIVQLPPTPPSPASDRRNSADLADFRGGRSEEFHGLRQFVPGDDIRRINWRSTARHDELIVREDEAPTQNHLTVIFDNASLDSELALDRGASVAGSIVASLQDRPDPFRLITSDGQDTGFVSGASGVDDALTILAVVGQAAQSSIIDDIKGTVGAAVVVSGPTSTLSRADLGADGRIMWISLEESAWDSSIQPTNSHSEAAGTELFVRLGTFEELESVWARAISTLISSVRG